MKKIQLITVIAALTAAVGALAQVPSIINYQGRLSAGGTNLFNGSGQFKFALVNGGTNLNWQATAVATVSGGYLTIITVTDGGHGYGETPGVTITDATGSNAVAIAHLTGGAVTSITVPSPGSDYSPSPTVTVAPPPPNFAYVTHWSNDGSSTGGGAPGHAVPLPVNQGLFSVNLGDTGLSNMTAVIPPSVFTNADVRLRIWFSDGVAPFQQFYPDQRLTSAGYALMAANVTDGAITSPKLAPGSVSINAIAANAITTTNIVDGAITSSKLAPGAASGVPNGMAVFTSSGTWTRPAGVSRVHVRLWGGGGGGGGNATNNTAGAGGGGGGFCEGIIAVTGNVSVTVGSGGATSISGQGGTGGNSSFLSLTAYGGVGGNLSSSGLGGSASGGSLNVAGQNGYGAGGGNAALGGGSGYVSGYLNWAGTLPGGGGGGGYGGGAGGSGVVIVYY